MSVPTFSVWGVTGIPEIAAGDDLVALISAGIAGMGAEHALVDGDILVVTSKIVSKAEGRQVPAADREKAIADDTVRVVAERVHPGGVTRIVETKQGMIMAAAGLDMSNVPEGFALKLPEDPDRSARALCEGLRERVWGSARDCGRRHRRAALACRADGPRHRRSGTAAHRRFARGQ